MVHLKFDNICVVSLQPESSKTGVSKLNQEASLLSVGTRKLDRHDNFTDASFLAVFLFLFFKYEQSQVSKGSGDDLKRKLPGWGR